MFFVGFFVAVLFFEDLLAFVFSTCFLLLFVGLFWGRCWFVLSFGRFRFLWSNEKTHKKSPGSVAH